jgi:hypothetical protein
MKAFGEARSKDFSPTFSLNRDTNVPSHSKFWLSLMRVSFGKAVLNPLWIEWLSLPVSYLDDRAEDPKSSLEFPAPVLDVEGFPFQWQ